MEKQNIYEVTELQEYNENQRYQFPDASTNSKHAEGLSAKLKAVSLVLVAGFAVVIVLLIAILGVQIVHLSNSFSVSDTTTTIQPGLGNTNGNANSSADVGSNGGPNCSIVYNDWSDAVQNQMFHLETQVGKLINTSSDTAWKINDIHNTVDSQTELTLNNTEDIDKILNTTGNSAQKLINIVNTLSNIEDTCTSTAGVADDILLIAQELLELHNESSVLPTSCQQIKQQQPNSPSGVYVLAATDGTSSYNTYCNMDELCGSGGGWTRLAYLDMSDSTVNCPSGFRLYQSGGVRACGRPVTSSGSCVSVEFPSNGMSYSQVCGRVTGYQYYTPDGVHNYHGSNHNNLNGDYVDGVSITRGSPRQHVWTLIAGLHEGYINTHHENTCPCSTGSTQQVQSFVGDHYFCESAITTDIWQQQLYTSDPLWDGQSCGSTETACCNVPDIPWFHRDYGNTTTTDYIELRVCGDEGTDNEDVPVSYYEIYVQ